MGKKKEWISRCGQSVECSICSIEKLYLLKLWKCICRGPAAVRSSQWTAAVQIFQLSWWWQQFPTGGSSSNAQLLPQCRLQSPILLLSLCLASVVAAVAIALLCCLVAVVSPVLTVTSVLTQFNSLGIGQRIPCGEGANLWNIEQEVSNQPDSDMLWQAKS